MSERHHRVDALPLSGPTAAPFPTALPAPPAMHPSLPRPASHRRRWLPVAVAILLPLAWVAASGNAAASGTASGKAKSPSSSAQRLLEASDRVRNPSTSFSLTTTLVEYRKGKQSDSATVTVYSHLDEARAQYRSLVRYVAPAREVGKLTLKSGKDLWFYDPASQASIRISPQQRLLGQASNGDVISANFAADYTARFEANESVQDGDRKTRKSVRLHLGARTSEATYHHVRLWLDAGNNHPIKAQFHADSGRLLKTVYYRRYQHQLGGLRPTEQVIIDALEPGWITVMRYSNFVERAIPAAWLQRDYLPQFKPEAAGTAPSDR
ncbi:outer membrane lipoprotein-sorting protein [Cupriavidus sp. DL-D2]|uniref:outer membrane lipoprotein-sorting protein n=1 Tax=Cupriavidus sp. DL-D2 TaxID=3144974 RepID=UPI00321299A5